MSTHIQKHFAPSRQILWVHKYPPWSRWTNSGASRSICLELRRRGLLKCAIAPDFISCALSFAPGLLYDTALRIHHRAPLLFPKSEQWDTETSGSLGRFISGAGNGIAIYVFRMPQPVPDLPIRRYLFLNLSSYDARRFAINNTESLSDEQFTGLVRHQQQMLRWADGVIVPSTYAAESIHKDFEYPRQKITAFGYGPTFRIEHIEDGQLFNRSRFESARILFVGRDWSRKGGSILLQAMERVHKRLPSATLHVLGPTSAPAEKPWLIYHKPINKASRRGLAQLKELFISSSLFCMPTTCEPWGLVFSEAAECGLPIVGVANWSLPDIVQHGETGLLIESQNPDKLAAALLELLGDPERSMRFGIAARRRSREVLDWPHAVDRIIGAVSPELLRGAQPPPLQSHHQPPVNVGQLT